MPLVRDARIPGRHQVQSGNRGFIPDLSAPGADSDFYLVPADDPEISMQRIIELVKTRIPNRFGLDHS